MPTLYRTTGVSASGTSKMRDMMLSGSFMLLALPSIAGCSEPEQTSRPASARISIDLNQQGPHVNRAILGNNVQWVDNGDGLLADHGAAFAQPLLDQVKALAPTILRYPGGSLADLYHWKDGVGSLSERRENEHFFSKARQKVAFGTQEFLELCEAVGAEPLITVNTATGTPQEAADWVALVNKTSLKSRKTGKLLPRVRYWEIGNEPYVKDDNRKELWITPDKFAAKVNLFIHAMKKVDQGIIVGVPLRSDQVGAVPATPFKGYNKTVLAGIDAPFEFVALHNAYLPLNYDPDKKYSDLDYYLATMAASNVVADDFKQTRALLRQLKPGKNIKLAVTEFNALYMFSERPEAAYLASMAGALYVADVLRVFATTPDLQFANFWSLSGNWHFGAIGPKNRPRPAYYILKMVNELLHGNMIATSIDSGTFDNPGVGVVPSYKATPLISGLATGDRNIVRVLLINKEAVAETAATLAIAGASDIENITLRYITAKNAFAASDKQDVIVEHDATLHAGPLPPVIQLAPRSVALVTIKLKN